MSGRQAADQGQHGDVLVVGQRHLDVAEKQEEGNQHLRRRNKERRVILLLSLLLQQKQAWIIHDVCRAFEATLWP